MLINKRQISAIGDQIFAARMRRYLNEQFPESLAMSEAEMHATILTLQKRAAGYKLITENQVTPFVVCAWILGLQFDSDFGTVKTVVENLEMDSNTKANWLWDFLEQATETLEGAEPPERGT